MKNNEHTTEELLKNGKDVRLSVSERADMKAALLSYAQYHGLKEDSEKRKSIFTVSSIWIRSIATASLAIVLFVGTSYASANSLPGEFLYPVKTNVVEELVAVTKFTPLSQLENKHKRYEMRLIELQTLSESGQLSADALYDSHIELQELSNEISALMSGEDGIEDSTALELVGNIVAMSNATEIVVRNNVTENELDAFESVTDSLEQVHENEISDLLTNSTSTIESFVQNQLSEIGAELADDDMEEIITIRTIDYIEDAEISLQNEDYEDVVNLVSDARILIDTTQYTSDLEDTAVE